MSRHQLTDQQCTTNDSRERHRDTERDPKPNSNSTTRVTSKTVVPDLRHGIRALLALGVILTLAVAPVYATTTGPDSTAESAPLTTLSTDTVLYQQDGDEEEDGAGQCLNTATSDGENFNEFVRKVYNTRLLTSEGDPLIDWSCAPIMVAQSIGELLYHTYSGMLNQRATEDFFGTPAPVPADSDAVIIGEPSSRLWQITHNNVWFGPMTGSALVLLVLALYIRSAVSIFGFSSQYKAKQFKRGIHQPLFLILMWYFIFALSLLIVRELGLAISPSGARIRAMYGVTVDSTFASLKGPVLVNAFVFFFGVLAEFLLGFFFLIQQIALPIFGLFMPLLIVGMYSNIPVLAQMSKSIAKRIVPLMFLRFPHILVTWLSVHGLSKLSDTKISESCVDVELDGGEFICPSIQLNTFYPGNLGFELLPSLLALMSILSLYLTWKLMTMSLPEVTQATGTAAGTAVGTTVGGTKAAGRMGAGAAVGVGTGNPALASSVARGRTGTGVTREMVRRTEND